MRPARPVALFGSVQRAQRASCPSTIAVATGSSASRPCFAIAARTASAPSSSRATRHACSSIWWAWYVRRARSLEACSRVSRWKPARTAAGARGATYTYASGA
eukprot:5237283-Prymnesium_polylepis.2